MSAFARIAVCVDDSPSALRALEVARSLGARHLTVVHCVEPPSFLVGLAAGIGGGIMPDSGPLLDAARAWVSTLTDEGEDGMVLEGSPARTIAHWAREQGCDLLVMASSRGAAERSVLGSFSQRMAHEAPCSVLVVHQDAE